ncbi:MAG: hypothetical protein K2O89_04650 [Clostridia bacterium]|nr:hypothetical protein [Clostridia bacterium]
MKFCKYCGSQVADEAVVCTNCGCATDNYVPKTTAPSNSTYKTVAKIFMIIGCVLSAFYLLIPLCWTIPMTIKYCHSIENNQPVSTGFKVCSLLFVSLIAGIFMLCDNDNN